MNVTNPSEATEDGVPQYLVESLRRNRYIEECGQIVERNALADDNTDLAAEMRRRARETRRLRFGVLHEIRAHRQTRAPARNHVVPRPRVRARRPRVAARRAAGERSGTDPGSEDDDPDDRPRPGTFESFHRCTPGLTGASRLRVFEALPAELQEVYWQNLAAELDGGAQ
jgi:hypothetical protein